MLGAIHAFDSHPQEPELGTILTLDCHCFFQVQTDDGFLLGVQRVSTKAQSGTTSRKPVFLYHGMLSVMSVHPSGFFLSITHALYRALPFECG